jgi:hypothetical protein
MADNKKSVKSSERTSAKNTDKSSDRSSVERSASRDFESDRGSDRMELKADKKKKGGSASALRDVMVGAMGSDALLDLVERLGLVDLVVGRIKSRVEDTDLDELLEEVTDYLRRNPEVLVVGLGAVTVATGLLVWMNARREWPGEPERRGTGKRQPAGGSRKK